MQFLHKNIHGAFSCRYFDMYFYKRHRTNFSNYLVWNCNLEEYLPKLSRAPRIAVILQPSRARWQCSKTRRDLLEQTDTENKTETTTRSREREKGRQEERDGARKIETRERKSAILQLGNRFGHIIDILYFKSGSCLYLPPPPRQPSATHYPPQDVLLELVREICEYGF